MPGGYILLNDVGAGDIGGHEVGSELDALEGESQRAGHRFHEQCLGQPRQARDERMTAHQQYYQHLVHGLVLSDNHFADLLGDGCAVLVQTAEVLADIFFGNLRCRGQRHE
jgi:hypothetical protein